MLELLESFRIHAAGRPLLIALAIAAALALAGRQRWARAARGLTGPLAIACLSGLVVFAGVALWYGADDHYFDAAEPTMTIVGWLFTLGQPLYHDPASAERYAHIYGPLAFIAHGEVQRLFGPGIVASKMLGAVAGLASLAATWFALTAATTRIRAAALTGACALVFLAFRDYAFWTRPEPLQLAAIAIALAVTARSRGAAGAVVLGVFVGVLANLKFTGPLYALPLVALILAGPRPWLAAAVAVAASIVTALPFTLANVSATSYVTWVRLSARNGLMLSMLRQNIEWAAFLLLAIAVAWFAVPGASRPRDRAWLAWLAALLLAFGAVAVAASKPGAGPYHLLPFVPLVAFTVARIVGDRPLFTADPMAAPAALGWVVAAVVLAVAWQGSFLRVMLDARIRDEAGDIRRFLDAHPAQIVQMAYNGYDRPTYARPELTFRSGVYLIDPPAVQEHQLSRLPLPPATIDAVRACRVDVWLVPRGTEPFAGPSRYPAVALAPIFPDALRAAFHDAYAPDGHTEYFDVWRCRARATP